MGELRVSGLSVPRVGFTIVREVDLVAPAGEVTVLLGPNGAGKTTLLEAISGLIPSNGGSIALDDRNITKASRVRRAKLGIAHVEQGRTVFADLTALENVRVAAVSEDAVESALAYFPELEQRLDSAAGLLSGGEQQMLVIARALASQSQTILVDEASLGLAPVIVQRLMKTLRRLADDGVGILLVEQYASLALAIGDSGYVINRGAIRLSGSCKDLAARPDELRDAYLGGGASADAVVAVAAIDSASTDLSQ